MKLSTRERPESAERSKKRSLPTAIAASPRPARTAVPASALRPSPRTRSVAASAIHATVEIGQEIRREHFAAVAAAIRFAEKMREKMRAGW